MPLATRSLAAAVLGSPRSQMILGGVVTCSVVALQLISEVKPWEPTAPVALSNQLVALMGLAWCAIQFWTLRRDAAARRAWSAAGAGMLLLALEDNVGRLFPTASHTDTEFMTVVLWLLAAACVFACGRRYAMRRSVMPAMRIALVIQLLTQGFVVAAILTAPLRVHGYPTLVDTVAELGELMAALTYLGALLMTSFAPLKTYRHPIVEIGRKAREIFSDFHLEKAARYPTPYRVLHGPVVRDVTFAAMALLFAPRGAASAREDDAVSAPRQVAGLLRCAAKGVDPVSYYLLGLYRRDAAPDAAITRTETKNGLTSAIQKAGRLASAPSEMSDKLDFWRICEANGVVSAPILCWFDRGAFESFADREAFDQSLFIKDRRGRGGKFTLDFERVGPFLYRGRRRGGHHVVGSAEGGRRPLRGAPPHPSAEAREPPGGGGPRAGLRGRLPPGDLPRRPERAACHPWLAAGPAAVRADLAVFPRKRVGRGDRSRNRRARPDDRRRDADLRAVA